MMKLALFNMFLPASLCAFCPCNIFRNSKLLLLGSILHELWWVPFVLAVITKPLACLNTWIFGIYSHTLSMIPLDRALKLSLVAYLFIITADECGFQRHPAKTINFLWLCIHASSTIGKYDGTCHFWRQISSSCRLSRKTSRCLRYSFRSSPCS